MTRIETILAHVALKGVKTLYGVELQISDLNVSPTNKEFEGDLTLMVFPLIKHSRKKPQETAADLGSYFLAHSEEVEKFNVVQGFLNLSLKASYWKKIFNEISSTTTYGLSESTGKKVLIEYCGPNTNKPLHLGHIRNMLLGYSMANILKAAGNEVVKVNIYNDRGIAICKSMLGWLKFGEGKTPESTGIKGDHFVGDFYVDFEKRYKAEVETLVQQGMTKEEAEKQSPLKKEADALLLKWEAGDEEVIRIWQKMNGWVYSGFEKTYDAIGVDFDQAYYESVEWTKGKKLIEEGLEKGVYFKKEDGSVWVDLTAEGLDQKILLRSDGTSVYLTQDLGMVWQRNEDHHMDQMVYVVANEQDYHFKVLKLTLQKLGKAYADSIYHLSYGLVDLPTGRMKTREGTVVDADDLLEEMFTVAKERTQEQGKVDMLPADELQKLYRHVGLAALKFFMLKVNPKKKILFNPQESIDFQGFTGPFVQYTHARIRSILRRAEGLKLDNGNYEPNENEIEIIFMIYQLPAVVLRAANQFDPSEIANYVFALAKSFNKFYDKHSILNAATDEEKGFRLQLSAKTAVTIQFSLGLLGIESPERM